MYILALIIALSVLAWDKTRQTSEQDVAATSSNTASAIASSSSQSDSTALPSPHNITLPASAVTFKQTKTGDKPSAMTSALITDLAELANNPCAPSLKSTPTLSPVAKRDLFKPDPSFIDPSPQETTQTAPLSFRLQGTMIQPGSNRALLNNQVVAEGDHLGNATIIQIESDNVVISINDLIVRIMLDKTSSTDAIIHTISKK